VIKKEWPCCNFYVLAILAGVIGISSLMVGFLGPNMTDVILGVVFSTIAVAMAMCKRGKIVVMAHLRRNAEQRSSLMHPRGTTIHRNSGHPAPCDEDIPLHAPEQTFTGDDAMSQSDPIDFQANTSLTPPSTSPPADSSTSTPPPPYEDAMDASYDPPPDYASIAKPQLTNN
jgi:hypothetical protein